MWGRGFGLAKMRGINYSHSIRILEIENRNPE